MTNKEALERLLCMAKKGCKVDMCNVKYVENASNIIKKDLEVLEIIKNESDNKRIIIKDGVASFHLDMILTTDNYNKVKEWLENDK